MCLRNVRKQKQFWKTLKKWGNNISFRKPPKNEETTQALRNYITSDHREVHPTTNLISKCSASMICLPFYKGKLDRSNAPLFIPFPYLRQSKIISYVWSFLAVFPAMIFSFGCVLFWQEMKTWYCWKKIWDQDGILPTKPNQQLSTQFS